MSGTKGILKVSSGGKWEDVVGYSRGIRVGDRIEIAGTTAADSAGNPMGIGDAYRQTCVIIERAQAALEQLGASLTDVIRTRMYVTDISNWEPVGKAHGEYFGNIKPVATMVEVRRLIHPDLLVEMEFSAMVKEPK